MNWKSSCKTSSRTYILFAAEFAGYQINNILGSTSKSTLNLRLATWQVNLVEYTRILLQISDLLLYFSVEQMFSFIALAKKYGDMSSFKLLFLLYVALKNSLCL